MELLLAIVAGVLYATGFYLMLRRRLAQLIVGLGLLANGSNVLIFTAGGLTRGKPPLHSGRSGALTAPFADPVPQSLILTAIVIGFGVLAFSLVLAHRVHRSAGTDDIDAIGPTVPPASGKADADAARAPHPDAAGDGHRAAAAAAPAEAAAVGGVRGAAGDPRGRHRAARPRRSRGHSGRSRSGRGRRRSASRWSRICSARCWW